MIEMVRVENKPVASEKLDIVWEKNKYRSNFSASAVHQSPGAKYSNRDTHCFTNSKVKFSAEISVDETWPVISGKKALIADNNQTFMKFLIFLPNESWTAERNSRESFWIPSQTSRNIDCVLDWKDPPKRFWIPTTRKNRCFLSLLYNRN